MGTLRALPVFIYEPKKPNKQIFRPDCAANQKVHTSACATNACPCGAKLTVYELTV